MALALSWSAISGQHRLIYPVPDRDIIVKEFSIPVHWQRAYGLDIRSDTVAAIWGALDPESDVLYLYSEYESAADPAVQVAAIRARAEWIPGLIDPAANGRERLDGIRLIQIYEDLGLDLKHMSNSVESGILEVSQRMRSGRLKVFSTLAKYLGDRRLYRRDENGQVVKDRDNLQNAVRCLVLGLSAMITEPEDEDEDEKRSWSFFRSGPGAWMT